MLRRQSRDTSRNIKGRCTANTDSLTFRALALCRFLSDEGPMLETLDYTIRIGSTPTFLYFEVHKKCISKLINNSQDKNKGNQHRDGVWICEEELT